jgi:hypothetical protein
MYVKAAQYAIYHLQFLSDRLHLQLDDTMRRAGLMLEWLSLLGDRAGAVKAAPASALPKNDKEFTAATRELTTWWEVLNKLKEDDHIHRLTGYPKFFFTHDPKDFDLLADLMEDFQFPTKSS